MKSGTLIRIAPDGTESVIDVPRSRGPTLEQLQKEVGGQIERIRVRYHGRVRDAYVDEDGRLKNLPPNECGYTTWGGGIVGPIVIWVPGPVKEKAK